MEERAIEQSLRARVARSSDETVHVVVEAVQGSERRLARSGVRLMRSIDGDLWLASVPVEMIEQGSFPTAIRRIWDLRPEDRRSPTLVKNLARRSVSVEPVRLRVKIFRDRSLDRVRKAARRAGGVVVMESAPLGIMDVKGPRSLVERMSELDDVRWLEASPSRYATANDGMREDAEINSVQALGIDGSGVIIGMWDSGLPDTLHPDLVGRVVAGESPLFTTLHSTHVAGVAMGDGTNSASQGGTDLQWRGVAPGASLVNYSVPGAIVEVDAAISNFGVDLTNNSWVYPVNEDTLMNCDLYGSYASDAPEFDDIVNGIYGKQIAVIFAAGNERDDGDCGLEITTAYGSIPPPGTAKNVITVGAHYSDVMHMTTFSSWGPTDDGRMKPDMAAPGCQQFVELGIKSTSLVAGGYSLLCGTSQAAPAVSGASALLIEEWRTVFGGNPRPATLKALLGGFAMDRANPGPDYRFGLGAINVAESVSELQTGTTIEDSITFPNINSYQFHVPEGTDTLKITLTWDDPVAAELADTTLVNNLDLKLAGPASGIHLPFVLDPANPSLDAVPGLNNLDNVEQVQVVAPEAGLWTAIVYGLGVVKGPQEFSMVGLDNRAPASPAFFTAFATDDTTSAVFWIRPGDADRAGTVLVRSTLPITWTPDAGTFYAVDDEPSPGVFVVAADDADYTTPPFQENDLAPGTTYFYSAFSYDEVPNYSPPVTDTITTTTVAVPAPVLPQVPQTITFGRDGPNPFATHTGFRFDLPRESRVSLEIFDTRGRRVAELVRGAWKAGSHHVKWSARGSDGVRAASGVYFARFRAPGLMATEKIILLR